MIMILALLEISVLNHEPILLIIENGLNMKKSSLENSCKFLKPRVVRVRLKVVSGDEMKTDGNFRTK